LRTPRSLRSRRPLGTGREEVVAFADPLLRRAGRLGASKAPLATRSSGRRFPYVNIGKREKTGRMRGTKARPLHQSSLTFFSNPAASVRERYRRAQSEPQERRPECSWKARPPQTDTRSPVRSAGAAGSPAQAQAARLAHGRLAVLPYPRLLPPAAPVRLNNDLGTEERCETPGGPHAEDRDAKNQETLHATISIAGKGDETPELTTAGAASAIAGARALSAITPKHSC
jgi:hypothetical protein